MSSAYPFHMFALWLLMKRGVPFGKWLTGWKFSIKFMLQSMLSYHTYYSKLYFSGLCCDLPQYLFVIISRFLSLSSLLFSILVSFCELYRLLETVQVILCFLWPYDSVNITFIHHHIFLFNNKRSYCNLRKPCNYLIVWQASSRGQLP